MSLIINEELIEKTALNGTIDEFRDAIEKHIALPYRNGMKLVHFASLYDLDGIFSKLMESGENANSRTMDGSTPVHMIACRGCTESMRIILQEFNGNPNAMDMNGWTPLHCAAMRSEFLGQGNNCIGIVDCLLDNGADVNALTLQSQNALHLIARSERPNVKIAESLLRNGCNWKQEDFNGMTPAQLAAWMKVGSFPRKFKSMTSKRIMGNLEKTMLKSKFIERILGMGEMA